MKPIDICSGWWIATEERFVNCYDTKEEALAHVKFQKKQMHSTANWYIMHVEITERKKFH